MQIRALRETDDRSRFRSGDPDLDRFLQRFAGQNQFKHYLGVTMKTAKALGISVPPSILLRADRVIE
jgi:hypothetical protein